MDVANITPTFLIAFHVRSRLTVMTDDCHANSILLSHVTKYSERSMASLFIGIDDIRATCSLWTVMFDFTAGFSWKQILESNPRTILSYCVLTLKVTRVQFRRHWTRPKRHAKLIAQRFLSVIQRTFANTRVSRFWRLTTGNEKKSYFKILGWFKCTQTQPNTS